MKGSNEAKRSEEMEIRYGEIPQLASQTWTIRSIFWSFGTTSKLFFLSKFLRSVLNFMWLDSNYDPLTFNKDWDYDSILGPTHKTIQHCESYPLNPATLGPCTILLDLISILSSPVLLYSIISNSLFRFECPKANTRSIYQSSYL